MLDKLVLHIPFHNEHLTFLDVHSDNDHGFISLDKLGLELACDSVILTDGMPELSLLRTKFETLSSGHSGMALKVYSSGMNCPPFVAIKCSPAKLLQGHNVYGDFDVSQAAKNMLYLLMLQKPVLYDLLDLKNTIISELDINYGFNIPDNCHDVQIINALTNISNGQTKSGHSYHETCYWGAKNSRLKKLKAYLKEHELKREIEIAKKNRDTEKVTLLENELPHAKNLLRLESTIKKRFLERRAIPTNLFDFLTYIQDKPNIEIDLFKEAFGSILKTMGKVMIDIKDDEQVLQAIKAKHFTTSKTGKITYNKALSIFRTFQAIRSHGYIPTYNMMTKSTFNRHIAALSESGLPKSTLQNLKGIYTNVVPLIQIIDIDLRNQLPEHYRKPDNLWLKTCLILAINNRSYPPWY